MNESEWCITLGMGMVTLEHNMSLKVFMGGSTDDDPPGKSVTIAMIA